jgi:hypothetical protein
MPAMLKPESYGRWLGRSLILPGELNSLRGGLRCPYHPSCGHGTRNAVHLRGTRFVGIVTRLK